MKHLFYLLLLSLVYSCEKPYYPPVSDTPGPPYVPRPKTDTADMLSLEMDTTLLLSDPKLKLTDYAFWHSKHPITFSSLKGGFDLFPRDPQAHTYTVQYVGTDKFAITTLYEAKRGNIYFSYDYPTAQNRTLFQAYKQGSLTNSYFNPYKRVIFDVYYSSKDTSSPDQVVAALNKVLANKDTVTLFRKIH